MKLLGAFLLISGFSGVLAQYGNPNKNKNKRPTTTTEIPESLNEVVPGVSVQPEYPAQQPNYNPQVVPQQQPNFSPQPQPGFPQQKPSYITQPQPQHPSQPSFNPQPQPVRPGYTPQAGSSNTGNNFQGVNAPSSSDYWWAGPNSPFKPGSQPAAASPTPQHPSSQQHRPGYGPQIQQQPRPQQPYQPQPQQPYQPQPQQPYQPQPQPPQQSQKPFQPQPQPQNPFQPQQPQQSQQPFRPQPQPQKPFQPQQQQPGFPSQPSRPQSSYGPSPGNPSSPSFPPSQPQSPYKPPSNNPGIPDQNQPYQPSNQGNTPLNINNNPYLSSALQNPVPIGQGQSCNGEGYYCVPSQSCYNGQISDNSGQPQLKFKKGPCSGGQVCCKSSQPQFPQEPSPQQPYPQQQYPQPGPPNTPYNRPGYGTEPSVQKYTGPLNTTPYPGCAAALKCVDISYCTAEGVMSDTPVALTYEQSENRVPLSDCLDMDTGVIGKCCRDPNYKDPWPAGMMMNNGFDDGQYHPEHQVQHHTKPTSPQPYSPQSTIPPQQHYTPPKQPPPPPSPQKPYNPPNQFPAQPPYTPPSQPPPQQSYNPQPPAQQPYSPPQAPPPPQEQQPPFNSPSNVPQQPSYNPQTPAPPAQQPYNPPQNPPVQPQPQPTSSPVAPKPGQTHSQVFPANEDKLYGNPSANAGINQIGLSGPEPVETNLPQSSSPSTPYPESSKPNSPTTSQSSYNKPPSPTSPEQECGVKGPTSSTKSDEASFAEFPWHAIIASDNGTALCSGAIIAPNAVLTVAHCVQSASPITLVIKVGAWSIGQPGPKPEQTVSVAVAAIHPAYDQGSRVKDQAVVITQQPVTFDDHVKKVCLPQNQGNEYSPKGGSCFATGFGRPTLQSGSPGAVLHKIEIKILPKNECESQLQQTHLGKYFFLNEGSTCAAPPSKSDLCKLDFGSPVVCDKGDGHYEVAGAYSWDTQCSSPAPGVVSSPDTDWILEVLDTPVETLKEQQKKPEIDTSQPEDIDSKPGFALGYGK